ncbi:MAG TPA: S41 family peptidase [Chitinophaga sp.]
MKPPRIIISLITVVVLAGSCKKDGDGEYYPTDSIGKINKWMLDSMRQFYYWNDAIPKSPNYSLQPEAFYKSLLYKDDRFSAIVNTLDPAPPNSSFYRFGFHFAFVQVAGYANYIGVITFVMPFSPAAALGLQRGTCFLQVDGQPVTAQNVAATLERMQSSALSLQLTLATQENNTWTPGNTVSINTGLFGENPIYYTRSFTAVGKKTGYLFYNYFHETFDADLMTAIDKLKRAGVSELILDLRYNLGGSVASSAKLAAMIADKLGRNSVYAIYEGNRRLGRRGRTLQEVLQTSGSNAGKNYDDLQSVSLHLGRVFILTTKATASAAELIINNLRPYLEVIQIGETTTGKDEASFLITDLRNPKQVAWELHPIVYKLFNSNNQGGYNQGLAPAYQVSELATLPLSPVGQASDPLIHQALELIYGSNIPGAPTDLRQRRFAAPCTPIFNSAATLARSMPPASVQY